jgi:molybdate transport system ATP-binding protein
VVAHALIEGLQADLTVLRGSFRLELRLSIPPGRTVALLGPNGSGKSTAVAALAGLLPIDVGRITLQGRTLDDPSNGIYLPPEQRKVGVVFQDYLLFPHLSAIENVAFGLRSRGVAGEAAASAAVAWMGQLGLEGLADHRPRKLSGGQAQRVALARALVVEPDLLLLDEPLSALDVTTRAELRRVLAEHLQRFSGPRLFITHDPTEAFLLADEIHVLEDGKVTQVGSADDIRLRPRTSYAADLAGSNLLLGVASHGVVSVEGQPVHIADTEVAGSVILTIRPSAVALHLRRPEGSARNTWNTAVDHIEHLGDRVRIHIGTPLPLVVEVTSEAVSEMGLAEGGPVWASIKATEISVIPDEASIS